MLRGGAATASVRVVPGDGEHAAAMPAAHLLRLALQRGALAACRADGVLRAQAHRHVDRVAGARHDGPALRPDGNDLDRSEEHTSELQSHGLISYAVFCL